MKQIFIALVASILLIIIINGFYSLQKNSVITWCEEKGYKIESIKSHLTPIGTPFYYVTEGHYIFEIWVTTPSGDKQHWWIRNGAISDDHILDKNRQ